MYDTAFRDHLRSELAAIREAGLYKEEREILGPQGPVVRVRLNGQVCELLNFCANNYLGLSADPRIVAAASRAMSTYGFGMSSVRFICGTQDLHKELERKIAEFCGTEDTLLYAACFDANGGFFEPFFTEQDAIISDELNHASIIDGIRLTKAKRYRYKNCDTADLEAKLQQAEAEGARFKVIATDAVFSMDGNMAPLEHICTLADRYRALVMVDESHSLGFVGRTGRGVTEHFGVVGKVDIITGTLGKALGGGIGGFTTGRREIIELLRQRSRPYLFSNSLPPMVVGAAIAVFELLSETTELRDRLERNTRYFRRRMSEAGFDIKPGDHPIVPIMLYDAMLAHRFANRMLELGIYVVGFSYPVVPRGQARIRVQISAAHTQQHLDQAIEAFVAVGREMGVLKD
ncbi:MAG: glycine C-acetyltransferase [Candidatus Kapabacteria bacterium]|nr:glycine C-acetyltransferase [Candidatus Kapabacteria bacterium]MDW8224408.1 glycine C-acetyltransferase [Bacteroidota bacterium]